MLCKILKYEEIEGSSSAITSQSCQSSMYHNHVIKQKRFDNITVSEFKINSILMDLMVISFIGMTSEQRGSHFVAETVIMEQL